jgi:hypothetical protein
MKWQISRRGGDKEYVCPSDHQIIMTGCRLRSQQGTAQKIFGGDSKRVCAWIECEEIEIRSHSKTECAHSQVSYNPRKAPYWVQDNQNVDGRRYGLLHTNGRGVFCPTV